MKKLISFMMVFLMLFSLCQSALAESPDAGVDAVESKADTGTQAKNSITETLFNDQGQGNDQGQVNDQGQGNDQSNDKKSDSSNSCQHENRTFMRQEMISPEYTTKDANGHIVSFYPQNVYRCTDCGKEIMDPQGTERISAYSPHVFYDGKCVVCDYDKSSCLHENKLLLGEERKILEYTSNGESGHTVKYVLQSVYSCPDCMETIIVDDPEAEEKEYTEAHYFYEGQCIRCQYESSCAHENKTLLSEGRDIRQYITTNDGNHKVCFYPLKNYCCLDCGEVIVETEEEMAEAVEAHSFSNGICVCGCLNKCTHENKILDSENRCYNIYLSLIHI